MGHPLEALLAARLEQLAERAPRSHALLQQDAALSLQARTVLLASDFVQRALIQDDGLLARLVADGSLSRPLSAQDYSQRLSALVAAPDLAESEYCASLRQLRSCELVRIAWRDLAGLASTHDTLRELSEFADAVIAHATRFAAELLLARHGRVRGPDNPGGEGGGGEGAGSGGGLVVLGMGKLGGSELNFSSDIDLVILHQGGGESDGAAPLAAEEYYTRQARTLIRLLDSVTVDGFVFRVDMRLRPFGDSGPLVASFAFFEDYLQSHGREWERYAYVKARALVGAASFAPLREAVLRPFVYRRYLDFGVFESLREMKALIAREVLRRDRADNVKLGAGGIREVEFIVQAFQLVRGGQDAQLREPSLLTVLPRLAGAKLLHTDVVTELATAYEFLRRLENRLQMLDDAQTHSLPAEALARSRIAAAMNFGEVAQLEAELAAQRAVVTRHFEGLFATPASASRDAGGVDLAPLWEVGFDRDILLERLSDAGYPEAEKLLALLEALRDSGPLKRLDEAGRKRLESLLESLVRELDRDAGFDALRRVFNILEAIGQRSAYFSLLLENRGARERLLALCREGDFLAAQIARTPALLDELIGERAVNELPTRSALASELAQRMSDVPLDDVELEVEALCRFKQAAVFRVALADLVGHLPLMNVSDRLTEIAEVILQRTLQLAWRQTTTQYGSPRCVEDASPARLVRVAALAYGKFGGRELGYGSDLDLVFLHDSAGDQQETDRETPVDNQVFFLRFAQRLLHLLTMHSGAGRLYEVDVRLRPSGKGGMLVTSIEAFRQYQFKDAWTWEHQALLHARAVAGDATLMARIETVRIEVLRRAVRRDDLRERIAEMRERMRRELSSGGPGLFDLKQDRGGVADIEFLAQYWALRWTDEYPPLSFFSDTIRQLESVASAALVPQETVDQLVRAYQRYRQVAHRRSLEGLPGVVDAAEFAVEREAVSAIWRETMSGL